MKRFFTCFLLLNFVFGVGMHNSVIAQSGISKNEIRSIAVSAGPGSFSGLRIGMAAAKGKEHVYSMAAKYRVGDIVLHQTFGKGIVLKLYVNKCDMLFKDRERLMATAN